MKSRKNRRSNLLSFAEIVFFAFVMLLFSNVGATPFIIKSVDGSWLPMIAQSWVAKNVGVLVTVAGGIKPDELQKEMKRKIPDLDIEIIGKDLYFPNASIDTLFEVLKDIDLDIAESEIKRATAENAEMFVKKSGENQAAKDEYTEASVENVVIDHEKIIVWIKIQQRAKSGAFIKLYGKYRIEHSFKMKNGIIDPSDAENKAFVSLVTMKKGSRISFIPEKNESRVLTIKPDFKIK